MSVNITINVIHFLLIPLVLLILTKKFYVTVLVLLDQNNKVLSQRVGTVITIKSGLLRNNIVFTLW